MDNFDLKEYRYDVAFSFCKEDENLANEISIVLDSNLSIFIYSKQQEDLVGSDGEIEFKRIFSEQSRVVVVLYREEYGKTPWTRMEEEAIRKRAYDEGYDFALYIPLQKDRKVPSYLPKTQIWVDLQRFGIQGAANIIGHIINGRGGDSKPASSEQKAERLKKRIDFEKKLNNYLSSYEAYQDAINEMSSLIKLGQEKAKIVFKGFNHHVNFESPHFLEFEYDSYLLQFHWKIRYQNVISDTRLVVTIFKQIPPKEPFGSSKYNSIETKTFAFSKNVGWENVWNLEKQNDYYKTDVIVEKYLCKFLEYIEKEKFNRRDNGFFIV